MKFLPSLVSIYKILASSFRLCIGLFVLELGWAPNKFLPRRLAELDNHLLISHIFTYFNTNVPKGLIILFAVSLIAISLIELVFSTVLLLGKRYGAVGLFITSIFWIPVEILFVSKFLLLQKTLIIIIDILILLALARILFNHKNHMD
jgi:hypothetical protein